MNSKPQYLRERQLIGNRKRGEPGRIPISHSTLWRWVKEARFPKPVSLGPRVTVWRLADIEAWESQQSA